MAKLVNITHKNLLVLWSGKNLGIGGSFRDLGSSLSDQATERLRPTVAAEDSAKSCN